MFDMHPTPEQLAAFRLGKLDEAKLDEIETHVAACAQCCAALQAIAQDSVGSLVRQSNSLAEALLANAASEQATSAPPGPERPGVETIALPDAGVAREPVSAAHASGVVAGYEILGELGRGGMGVVYRARQIKLNRIVALKMILAGSQAGRADLERFRTEAEAIARLQHPNIIQVFEINEHEGKPYFSLEFCAGGSLAQRSKGAPWQPKDAARLVETLARAMEAAHQRGVVHRDLKPANVLLLEDGTPKITDFGLAKRLDEASKTQSGAVMGTPSYMAPEQASGNKNIGPAADVYALGAVLYELLTGRPPFLAATALDTVLEVLSDDPVPPTHLQAKTPRDLETICLKCLQKVPSKRYATAEALADDLRSFGEGRPITARPVTMLERVGKWVKRRPLVAGLIGVSILTALSLVGLVVGWWYNDQLHQALHDAQYQENIAQTERKIAEEQRGAANQQRQLAFEQTRIARRYWYAADINWAERNWERGQVDLMHDLLNRQRPQGDEEDCRGFEWFHLFHLSRLHRATLPAPHGAQAVAFSADGKVLALGENPGSVLLWDMAAGRVLTTLTGHTAPVKALAFTADGRMLASAAGDLYGSKRGEVKLWDCTTWTEKQALPIVQVAALAFTADGKFLATGGKTVRVWDLATGREQRSFKDGFGPVAFSSDGHMLACAWGKGVKLFDRVSGNELASLPGAQSFPWAVVFTPDNKSLIATDYKTVSIWDVTQKRIRHKLEAHGAQVFSLALAADGNTVISGSEDKTVRLWDVHTGRLQGTFRGHTDWVRSVALARDSKTLASASADGTVRIWDASPDREYSLMPRQQWRIAAVAFAPDGHSLLSADYTSIRLYHWPSRKQQAEVAAEHWVRSVACAPDSKSLVSWGPKGVMGGGPDIIKFWDLTPTTVQGKAPIDPQMEVSAAAFWSDSRTLAVGGSVQRAGKKIGLIRLWRVNTGQVQGELAAHETTVRALACAPTGKLLASGGDDGLVKLWDAATLQERTTLRGHAKRINTIAFSRDGVFLASSSDDGTVRIWDLATGKTQTILKATQSVQQAVFAPHGKTVATYPAAGQTVTLWQVSTGQELLTLPHGFPVSALAFSPASDLLAVGSGWRDENEGVKLWHTTAE